MRFIAIVIVLVGWSCFAAAQATKANQQLEVTSDDFSRTRDLLSGKSVFVFKKPTYRLKRVKKPVKPVVAKEKTVNNTTKPAGYNLIVDAKSAEVWKRLGVTIWRLASGQSSVLSDKDAATIIGSGENKNYTPKRVSADTTFAMGDKVRLSFESPDGGYLYVIDRELYADGTVGEPILIFPTMMARGGNNRIGAGQLVDIPAQSDRVPYFTLQSKNKNWRGELLTVIISPEPLSDIDIPDGPSPIAEALVDAIESKYLKSVNEYEQQGSLGKAYTTAEKEAGASLTRELTQKDPFPQTMFKGKLRQREPMLVNFGLTVK